MPSLAQKNKNKGHMVIMCNASKTQLCWFIASEVSKFLGCCKMKGLLSWDSVSHPGTSEHNRA